MHKNANIVWKRTKAILGIRPFLLPLKKEGKHQILNPAMVACFIRASVINPEVSKRAEDLILLEDV